MTSLKKYVIAIGVIVACVGGGYAAGRYAAPDRVVVTEKTVTVEKEKIVTVVDTDRILNALKDENVQKDVHVVRVIERAADGSTKITVTQDDKSKSETETKVQDKEHAVQTQTVDRIVYKDRETTKLVERARPGWSLAIQPGYEFSDTTSRNLLGDVLPFKRVMANVALERRVLGPLFVGAWASSRLDGGLTLRVEW